MAEENPQMATGPAIVGLVLTVAAGLFFIIFLGQGAESANHMKGWLPGSATHLWP
jgi:hypothetical protein